MPTICSTQRRTLRRSQGMERKRQSSSFLSRNRLGCQTGKRFTDGSRPLGDRRDERKYFNYQTQTGEIIWKQSEGSPYSSWCWQFLPSSSLQNRFASFLSRKPGSSNDSENFTPCFSRPEFHHSDYRIALPIARRSKKFRWTHRAQICITKDNTQLQVDGVLYFQVTNPELASYGTSDFVMAITQLAADISQKRYRYDVARQNVRRT